ncbi:MAG TPA: DivIVA domain-containing protein [Longimicrobiales bacterium]|nr:DivIVA domain-containing protein [Longimicrobiales bacterium]
MMDLTPLDVRKKKGDFRRGIRGYEQSQVDDFLDLVADRMETLVRDSSGVAGRIARLEQQVSDYQDRERALTEALVSAQQMREDIRSQSTREVELLRKQAQQDADRIRAEAVRMREHEEQGLEMLRSRQFQFLSSYRKYLEQELSELTAMTHGLEMHAAGSARPADDPPRGGPGLATPSTSAIAAAPVAPVLPAAEPPELFASTTAAGIAPVVEVEPQPASEQPASGPDAPLAEALARWEPELGPDESARVRDAEPDDDFDDDADDLVLSEDDDDLLLSSDDVVTGSAEGAAQVDTSEEDVDLAFLDFGEDDTSRAAEAAVEAATAERVEQDVSAAMVERASYLDIGTALGDEPTEFVASVEPAAVARSESPRDEMDDVIDAAFDFDGGIDDSVETLMSGPRLQDSPPSAAAREPEAGADDDDIDFVDSLLLDAESAFEEEPAAALNVPEASTEPQPPHAGDRPTRHAEGADAPPLDEEYNDDDSADPALIDLDSICGLSRYEPPSPTTGDVSALTLHPMFFEQDAGEMEAEAQDERQDHWSSSGGG